MPRHPIVVAAFAHLHDAADPDVLLDRLTPREELIVRCATGLRPTPPHVFAHHAHLTDVPLRPLSCRAIAPHLDLSRERIHQILLTACHKLLILCTPPHTE